MKKYLIITIGCLSLAACTESELIIPNEVKIKEEGDNIQYTPFEPSEDNDEGYSLTTDTTSVKPNLAIPLKVR